jgi:formylglycine-generating enzyme required for sulfatase activity
MRGETTGAGRVDASGCALRSRDLRIDAICECYEAAWGGTIRPEMETYLVAVSEPERPALLRELMALDIELRRGGGERPTLGEYLARFPGFDDHVADAFGLCPSARLRTLAFGAGVGPRVGLIPSIPGYEVLGVLGRGGMGVVYRARQLRLDRPCALKMILAGVHAGPEAAVRFLSEAQLIARLRHPNVLQIHALGAVDEGPFLELEYADGGSLSERIDGTPWKPCQAAGLIAVLARAADDMHRLGIVHRDLKPANVLLMADGTPKIADFGLAKMLGRSDALTLSKSVLGTPYYMSPEQADGRVEEVGPAADVYALGVMLYELLTGRPPFRGASALETLEQVRSALPVPPSRLVPSLHRDLETICLKCLHKVVARRYHSALAMAEDLERWLAGMPILGRRAGPLGRAWKWCRRHPAPATWAAMSYLLAVGSVWAAVVLWNAACVLEATARERVEMLKRVETAAVPEIVDQLDGYRRWADPLLARASRECDPRSKAGLHVALAMLPVDPGRQEFLLGRPTDGAARPEELFVVRNALMRCGYDGAVLARLWAELEGLTRLNDGQLRVVGALAGFAPDNPRWKHISEPVATKLIAENPLLLGHWRDVFLPVGDSLRGPLLASYYDRRNPERRVTAEGFLLDFVERADDSGHPEHYVDLLIDADEQRFGRILHVFEEHAEWSRRAIARMEAILAGPGDGDETRSRHRGRAATALVRLGHAEAAWRLLGKGGDPASRTHLIQNLSRFGVDPRSVIARLAVEADASARRALVLALGCYPIGRIPDEERRRLTRILLHEYRDVGDAGLHSAIDWLLRQVWGQAAELGRIDREASGPEAIAARDWYTNGQRQTFSVIRGPVQFLMGSPDDEPGRYEDENRHRVRIDRTFAIATREVTLEQYVRFLDASQGVQRVDEKANVRRLSPTPDCPAVEVDWYDAARYCNWLSRREGIPQSQWCYPPEIKEGTSIPGDCLNRTGYRLPTEAEWEYACRAGSTLSRPDGVWDSILHQYGWYSSEPMRSNRQHLGVGRLKPNEIGLFDMLGNAWEWTHEPSIHIYAGGLEQTTTDKDPGGPISNQIARGSRGGASDCCEPRYLRSAMRNRHLPHSRYGSDGFRVARTIHVPPPIDSEGGLRTPVRPARP